MLKVDRGYNGPKYEEDCVVNQAVSKASNQRRCHIVSNSNIRVSKQKRASPKKREDETPIRFSQSNHLGLQLSGFSQDISLRRSWVELTFHEPFTSALAANKHQLYASSDQQFLLHIGREKNSNHESWVNQKPGKFFLLPNVLGFAEVVPELEESISHSSLLLKRTMFLTKNGIPSNESERHELSVAYLRPVSVRMRGRQ